MNDIIQDVVFAWRNALKRPGTALLIIITLALGIGANTAMFSMTYHMLLAPLPYEDSDRLVKLEQHETARHLDDTPWSLPTIADLREQNSAFSSVLQYFEMRYIMYSDSGPFVASTGIVDGNFFAVLGLKPALGRILTPNDNRAGAAPVMLLTDQFWKEAFGGDPDVIGSTVEMSNLAYTIVGVLPVLPPYPGANDIWIPAANDWVMSDPGFVNDRSEGLLTPVIGKLRDGVSLDQARRDLELFSERLANMYPDIYGTESGYTITLRPLKEAIAGSSSRTLTLLMSLALLVALIASTNFANITLANMLRRSQELAVREAVGADPGRVRRQLFTENILISIIGGLAGLVLAAFGLGFITDFAAIYTPFSSEINLDGSVLWFCLTVSLASGLLSAVVASSHTRDINQALKEGGDKVTASVGAKNLKDILLAVQCALAFVMLTSTALMASSLYRLVSQPTGYDTEGVVALSTIMRGVGSETMWPERDRVLQVLEETRALPGVTAAGLSGTPLLEGPAFSPRQMLLSQDGSDGNRTILEPYTIVSQGFFNVMNVPLLTGRTFANTDDQNAPRVVLVNESFAERYFPTGAAVGQRLSMNAGNTWQTIVGVVGNMRARGIDTPDTAMVYTNYRSSPTQIINFYVKTTGDLKAAANAVSDIMQRVDPLQPMDTFTPLDDIRDRWLAPTKLRTGVIAAFGILALVVTLSGVIGVVSYNINQRVREIGMHMAIGANPHNVMAMFISQGLKIYVGGLLMGLALMIVVTPLIQPLLYETSAIDVRVYLASTLVLTVAVLIAMYVPARKASVMSPSEALHCE